MSTPAGWYDDGQGAHRWWDGTQWTEHVQPAVPPVDAPDAAAHPQGGPYVPPGHPQAGAPEKKSKLWIVWVVLGGVVLLLGILAAIIVPMLIGLFGAVGGTVGGAQRGAAAAIELYDDAWNGVDCDAYQNSTTADYRESLALTDCAAFEERATAFAQSVDDYDIEVTSVSSETINGEASAVATTIETYESLVDVDGNPLDEAEDVEERYVYTLIEQDGVWLIDQLEAQ